MKSRSLLFTCAVLLTATTMSTTAHADVGQQMESLAVAIEAGGDPQSAADLRSAVAQVPPETLDRIYANIDLMPLAAAFTELSISKQKSAEALKQLPAPLQEFQRQNSSLSSSKKCDRENDYYGCFPKSTGTICTAWSDTSANPMRRVSPNLLVNAAVTVATLQGTTSIAAKAANIAKIAFKSADDACAQVQGAIVLGEGEVSNFELACLPADVVWGAAQALLEAAVVAEGFAKDLFNQLNSCNTVIDRAQIHTAHVRLNFLKSQLDTLKRTLDVTKESLAVAKQHLLEASLARRGGGPRNTFYNTVITTENDLTTLEACEAALGAGTEATQMGYVLNPRFQPLYQSGLDLIETDPKRALEHCRRAYRVAADKSTRMTPED